MRLTLVQEQAITELAKHLYDFLPGQPHPMADQAVSFQGAAQAARLGRYWQGGSKQPAITALLRATLENQPSEFCNLMNLIVRKGLHYRSKRNPITREEIERLNDLIQRVGFKIPELHDRKFLDGLPSNNKTAPSADVLTDAKRKELLAKLQQMSKLAGQPRGYAFADLLQELFSLSGLQPRSAFRIRGEEIDGSFMLQAETYLLEATWRNSRVGEEELNSFSGKVHGKAAWSRGLHISYAGYTPDGLDGFARGKRTAIVCMEGLCLNDLLHRKIDLSAVIARKVQRAAETNEAFVPVRDLFPEVK